MQSEVRVFTWKCRDSMLRLYTLCYSLSGGMLTFDLSRLSRLTQCYCLLLMDLELPVCADWTSQTPSKVTVMADSVCTDWTRLLTFKYAAVTRPVWADWLERMFKSVTVSWPSYWLRVCGGWSWRAAVLTPVDLWWTGWLWVGLRESPSDDSYFSLETHV